jgi:hypothetical protein
VVLDHACGGEPGRHSGSTCCPVECLRVDHALGHLVLVLAEITGHAVLDDLRRRPDRKGQDWRAGRESLDHHQPERFGPLDRVQKRSGSLQQRDGLVASRLADIGDVGTQQWLDAGVEPRPLRGLAHLRRDAQRDPGRSCHPRRGIDTFVRVHPTEEQQVAPVSRTGCHLVGVETVMDHTAHLDALHRRLHRLRV